MFPSREIKKKLLYSSSPPDLHCLSLYFCLKLLIDLAPDLVGILLLPPISQTQRSRRKQLNTYRFKKAKTIVEYHCVLKAFIWPKAPILNLSTQGASLEITSNIENAVSGRKGSKSHYTTKSYQKDISPRCYQPETGKAAAEFAAFSSSSLCPWKAREEPYHIVTLELHCVSYPAA